MRLKVTLAIIASMAVCSQSFGFDLLDRMLGGSGCASSCCETAASCGCDNVGSGCASGAGCKMGGCGPSCGADNGCAGAGGCGLLNGCRHKLLTFEQKCVSIRVPKINLPQIKMPKLGCCDPCKAGCCDNGCASGAGNGCCAVADPSCGCDNGCGARKGCCKAAAPSCGCDNGCGAGNGCGAAAPSCGCDNACAPACCKPGLLDRIRSRMACHKACRCANANAGCCQAAAPSCGCDNGCGAGHGAACGCDNYTAPAAAPATQPVPPQPVVDPAAFNTRSNRIIQASLSDR